MGWIIGLLIAAATAGSWHLSAFPDWSPYAIIIAVVLFAAFARVIAKTLLIGLLVGILLGLIPIDWNAIHRAIGF